MKLSLFVSLIENCFEISFTLWTLHSCSYYSHTLWCVYLCVCVCVSMFMCVVVQIISSVLQEIVNNFVNDRSSSEVMAVGLVQLLLRATLRHAVRIFTVSTSIRYVVIIHSCCSTFYIGNRFGWLLECRVYKVLDVFRRSLSCWIRIVKIGTSTVSSSVTSLRSITQNYLCIVCGPTSAGMINQVTKWNLDVNVSVEIKCWRIVTSKNLSRIFVISWVMKVWELSDWFNCAFYYNSLHALSNELYSCCLRVS